MLTCGHLPQTLASTSLKILNLNCRNKSTTTTKRMGPNLVPSGIPPKRSWELEQAAPMHVTRHLP